MAKLPKRSQFIHDRYWAVSPYYGAREISAHDAREAWRAADRVDGTAEFGFQTSVYTDGNRSTLGTSFLPMTSYPLPPELVELLKAGDGTLTLLERDSGDGPDETPEQARIRHRVARRLGALLLVLALPFTAAGSCGSTASGAGKPAASAAANGGSGCEVPGADAFVSCCKVGTEKPKVVDGAVHGAVEVSCDKVPDIYNLTAFLYYAPSKKQATPGDEKDLCQQDDPADVGLGGKEGVRCAVATSCLAGYYVVAYSVDVDIDGAPGTATDDATYATTFTKAQCRA